MGAKVDITGQRFGYLVAIEPTEKRVGNKIVWRCKCDCGNEHFATAKDLRSGNTKSCGCKKHEIFDLTGLVFGKLTVIGPTGKTYQNNQIWHCKCACGNEVDVLGRSLTSGNTKSCGCLNHAPRAAPPDCISKTRVSALNKTVASNNTSGARGVSFDKRSGKWEAYIKFQGRHYHLGQYDDIKDAIRAREEAESKTFDEFLSYYTSISLRQHDVGRNPKDIQGQRFGSLTALYPKKSRKNTSVVWRCQCDCGNLLDVKLNHLTTGHTATCPECGRKRMAESMRKYQVQENPREGQIKDLTGLRVGFLRVMRHTDKRRYGNVVWICKCDCGKEINLTGVQLAAKTSKMRSCGCTIFRRGKYYRVCSVCGKKYNVIPGQLGTICENCSI